jgi:Tfp pilus assembly major pilin PilA
MLQELLVLIVIIGVFCAVLYFLSDIIIPNYKKWASKNKILSGLATLLGGILCGAIVVIFFLHKAGIIFTN